MRSKLDFRHFLWQWSASFGSSPQVFVRWLESENSLLTSHSFPETRGRTMKCPHCSHDPMQPGRAENRRHEWYFQVNPMCWFVADDGSPDSAIVQRNTNPRALRCPKCRTVVVVGEEPA